MTTTLKDCADPDPAPEMTPAGVAALAEGYATLAREVLTGNHPCPDRIRTSVARRYLSLARVAEDLVLAEPVARDRALADLAAVARLLTRLLAAAQDHADLLDEAAVHLQLGEREADRAAYLIHHGQAGPAEPGERTRCGYLLPATAPRVWRSTRQTTPCPDCQ